MYINVLYNTHYGTIMTHPQKSGVPKNLFGLVGKNPAVPKICTDNHRTKIFYALTKY